jgi:hypothetical protein
MNIQQLPISNDTLLRMQTGMANCLRYPRIRISIDAHIGNYVWCTATQEAVSNNGTVYDRPDIHGRALAAVRYMEHDGLHPVVCAYTMAEPGAEHTSQAFHRVEVPGVGDALVCLRRPRTLHALVQQPGRTSVGALLAMDADACDIDAARNQRAAVRWLKAEYFRARSAELETTSTAQPGPSPRVAKAIELLQQANAAELEAVDKVLIAEGLQGQALSDLLTSGQLTLVSTGNGARRVRTYYRGRRRLLTIILQGITIVEIRTY